MNGFIHLVKLTAAFFECRRFIRVGRTVLPDTTWFISHHRSLALWQTIFGRIFSTATSLLHFSLIRRIYKPNFRDRIDPANQRFHHPEYTSLPLSLVRHELWKWHVSFRTVTKFASVYYTYWPEFSWFPSIALKVFCGVWIHTSMFEKVKHWLLYLRHSSGARLLIFCQIIHNPGVALEMVHYELM